MTQAERSMVFQVLTSINGYGPNKVLTTDDKKQIKWIDKKEFVESTLPKGVATEAFVKEYSDSIVYYFGETFTGDGLTKETPINVKK